MISMEDAIEKLAEAIADADDNAQGAWPEFDGDDGHRPGDHLNAGGYIMVLSNYDQDNYRAMAKAAWHAVAKIAVAL